jgi:hypothetical protein
MRRRAGVLVAVFGGMVACAGHTAGTPSPAADAGGDARAPANDAAAGEASVDAGNDAFVCPLACCGTNPTPIQVSPAAACKMLQESGSLTPILSAIGPSCQSACGGEGNEACALPPDYVERVRQANEDASEIPDGASIVCPAVSGTVAVFCADASC